MSEPRQSRAWAVVSALLVAAIAVAVCLYVQKRSEAPPPPERTLPYP